MILLDQLRRSDRLNGICSLKRSCHLKHSVACLQAMRPDVQSSPIVQLVLRMRTTLAGGNWVAFFKAVQKGPYLLACAAHAYFRHVRAGAMATMSTGELVQCIDACSVFHSRTYLPGHTAWNCRFCLMRILSPAAWPSCLGVAEFDW